MLLCWFIYQFALELIQIIGNWQGAKVENYFGFWNLLDIARLILLLMFFFQEIYEYDREVKGRVLSCLICVSFISGLQFTRVIKDLRKFIELLGATAVEMTGFNFVLGYTLFAATSTFYFGRKLANTKDQ